jgi:endonuclease/exonuclease/phosphatase family metal-dependent hydrolase
MVKDVAVGASAYHWSRAMTYFGEGGFHHDEGLAVVMRTDAHTITLTHTTYLSRNYSDPQDEHQRVLLHVILDGNIHLFNVHMSLSLQAQRRNAIEILKEMRFALCICIVVVYE